MAIKIGDILSEMRRELAMRKRVYPNWIRDRRMKKEDAKTRIARLEAGIELIENIANGGKQEGLF